MSSNAPSVSLSELRKLPIGAHTPDLPFDFRILKILFPVMNLTWGIPCESLRMTPIWEGPRPLRASLKIWSETSSGVALDHEGWDRR